MNRTARNRLLLFFAVFHLLSDVAYAGGAILCVGPDDHRAIESEHLAKAGCQSTNLGSPAPILSVAEAEAPEDCTDSPLHSEAEIVTSKDPSQDVQPPLVASSVLSSSSPTSDHIVRPRSRAPDESSSLRVHRTIVLLI